MRLLALTAAGLVTGSIFVVAAAWAASGAGAGEGLHHTCSATDRQFIRVAGMHMTAVGEAGREYLSRGEDGKVVVATARRAARTVDALRPTDPALRRARLLVGAMLAEYGRAVQAREAGGEPGPHMYKVYGFANFANEVLRGASRELDGLGCDVSALL